MRCAFAQFVARLGTGGHASGDSIEAGCQCVGVRCGSIVGCVEIGDVRREGGVGVLPLDGGGGPDGDVLVAFCLLFAILAYERLQLGGVVSLEGGAFGEEGGEVAFECELRRQGSCDGGQLVWQLVAKVDGGCRHADGGSLRSGAMRAARMVANQWDDVVGSTKRSRATPPRCQLCPRRGQSGQSAEIFLGTGSQRTASCGGFRPCLGPSSRRCGSHPTMHSPSLH
ncbi:hypothetical protein L1887_62013 [Cichorium endivia]|nr:hypothetical protein L1887_62013 [Cichorium endivia]